MPPYGLYSLANTPEELLNRGYGYTGNIPYRELSNEEQNLMRTKYDPAFGNLNTQMGYFSAPYTGGIPFQNVSFLKDDGPFGLGYDGDIDNPSFGGASNINYNQFKPEEVPTNIMEQASGFPLYDDFTVAEEGDDLEDNAVTVDQLGNLKQPPGFKDFFKTMLGFAIPGSSLFMGDRSASQGIKSLNQRLRNTDFGRSKNLMDYLDMRKYGGYEGRENRRAATMAQARGIQKKIDTGKYRRTANDNVIDRGRGESNIASRAPKGPTGARRGIDARNKSSIDPAEGRRG